MIFPARNLHLWLEFSIATLNNQMVLLFYIVNHSYHLSPFMINHPQVITIFIGGINKQSIYTVTTFKYTDF